jgi:hypothetical protein
MNFAEIETLWRSPRNRPDTAGMEKQKMYFVALLKKRRRTALGLLGVTAVLPGYLTLLVASHLLGFSPRFDRVDLGREWASVPFLFLPWVGWCALLCLYRRHRARHRDYEGSVQASVQALLDENRTEQTRHKWIAGLLVASLALLPVIVAQLRAAGKAGDEILAPAYVIYPAYVLGILAWTAHSLRRKLLPRQRELEALVKSYE